MKHFRRRFVPRQKELDKLPLKNPEPQRKATKKHITGGLLDSESDGETFSFRIDVFAFFTSL
jgi:hypothetical protein